MDSTTVYVVVIAAVICLLVWHYETQLARVTAERDDLIDILLDDEQPPRTTPSFERHTATALRLVRDDEPSPTFDTYA